MLSILNAASDNLHETHWIEFEWKQASANIPHFCPFNVFKIQWTIHTHARALFCKRSAHRTISRCFSDLNDHGSLKTTQGATW